MITNEDYLRTHLILRLTPDTRSARVRILFYDILQPIEVFAEKRFHFALEAKEQVVFVVMLEASASAAEVDFHSLLGKLSFSASTDIENFTNFSNLVGESHKTVLLEQTKNVSNKNSDKEKSAIFQRVYISVKATALSRFSILVKARDRFKELTSLEPEVVFADEQRETYLYYHLSETGAREARQFQIEVDSVAAFSQKPKLLFVERSDLALSAESKFEEMPVLQVSEVNSESAQRTLIRPEVKAGFYVLKLEAEPGRSALRVSVSTTGQKSIELNGLYKKEDESGLEAGVKAKSASQSDADWYNVYLPEAGEFRLVFESCVSVKVAEASFSGDSTNSTVLFQDHLQQVYPFIYEDARVSSANATRELRTLRFPIERAFIQSPGVLKFRVEASGVPTSNIDSFLNSSSISILGSAPTPKNMSQLESQKTYTLMSEFRPEAKELILKDYIELFGDDQTFKQARFSHQFVEERSKLLIRAGAPRFKPQLLEDYPDLKRVSIKFYFYLVADAQSAAALQKCGLAAASMLDHSLRSSELVISRAELVDAAGQSSNSSDGAGKGEVEVEFGREDVDKFDDAENLFVFSYLSVRFFENEEEEWRVSLDVKFANVPFFMLALPNNYLSPERMELAVLVGFTILLALLIILYYVLCRKPSDAALQARRLKDDSEYAAPGFSSMISRDVSGLGI